MDRQDERLKILLGGTRLRAGENLKFRIMHQIETENALLRKMQKKQNRSIWGNFSILAVMYVIIAVVGGGIYYSLGENALESSAFYLPMIFIAAVCGVFFLISTFDDRRKHSGKQFKN